MIILSSTAAFVLLVSAFVASQTNARTMEAVDGSITVTRESLQQSGIIKLDGEWRYHEGIDSVSSMINVKVPNEWANYITSRKPSSNYGNGTFVLNVNLPEEPNGSWALYIPDVRTARQVYIDGIKVEQQGSINRDYKKTIPYDLPSIVFFHTNKSSVEIKIIASNNVYALEGGIHKSISLGTASAITGYKSMRVLTVVGTASAYVVFGFIFLIMFLYRRKDFVLIAFSVYCFSNAMLYLTNNELIFLAALPKMSYETFRIVQFVTAASNVVLLLIYTKLAIPRQTNSLLYRTLLAGSVLVVFVPVLFPIEIQTRISFWHPFVFLGIVVAVVGYSLKAVIDKEEFSNYFYISALSLLAVFTMYLLGMYGKFDVVVSPLYAAIPFAMANAAFLAARHSKAHEKAEKLALDLQRQDKVKNDFLAKTSHEFRTPLHGIMNMIGLYIEREKQFMKDEDLENMRLVLDISNRLSRLVNDILDMEQMNEHKLRMNYTYFSLEKCLMDVVNVCRYVYAEYGNQITLTIDQELPPVFLDSDRLKQILYNLLDNALNHTQSGTISIQTSMDDDRWIIIVRDDGEGIPADKLDQIFSPYEHFSNTKNFGVGIGLSIVKQLTDYMGGSIRVESEYGHGTSFRLEFGQTSSVVANDGKQTVDVEEEWMLPLSPQLNPKSSDFSTPHLIHQNGEHSILLVDDNFSNLKVMIDALRNDGHNIVAVKNGVEMLDVIRSHPDIDLVVLDLLLPDYSGYELCGMLRETMSMVELPILILTAAINPEDLQYALSRGANDFIHKPYPVNELRARVNSLLHMKSAAKRSATYEIAFLHAQIKPHFLYNALNTIAEFCIKDPSEASSLIISLSKYLRGTLDFSNLGNLISVDRELALVKAYLKIEKARFPELETEFDMDQNIDVQLPPMTLQVLVENAVKHGVICRENGGLVKIAIKNVEGGTLFSVENDGTGILLDQIEEILTTPKAEGSIGLYNVNTRLMKMYGTGLTFSNHEESRFKVSFYIPDWRNS